MGLLSRLNAFNRKHPWSHNDLYLRWVTRQARDAPRSRALDVGCGTGNLVERLRRTFDSVIGVEPDVETARYARRRFEDDARVQIQNATLSEARLDRDFDTITLIAVLHQLPLRPTLEELRSRLTPTGRLIVVGCYREATRSDRLLSILALAVNPVVGFVKHPKVATSMPVEMSAPVADPTESLAEIRKAVKDLLPGARLRRRLFWRYSMVYVNKG